jgi:hypothetical protein
VLAALYRETYIYVTNAVKFQCEMKIIFTVLLSCCAMMAVHAQSSGNVGIGTTTPTQKLEVSGNIKTDTAILNSFRMNTDAGAGKVLTSNANGVGTWQPLSLPPTAPENAGYGGWGNCEANNVLGDYFPVADTLGNVDDYLGYATSISGDYAVVGAYLDDETFADQGSVSLYHYNAGAWDFVTKILDQTPAALDYFGYSVALSGNFLMIGAYADDEPLSNQGSVTVYRFNGTNWVFHQKLIDPGGVANDNFGWSVAISGDYAIIGAPNDNVAFAYQGSACIFHYNGSTWQFMEKISDGAGAAIDQFGWSVAISGTRAIVGAPFDDVVSNANAGSILLYEFNGTNWLFKQKITDAANAAQDYFGYDVAISGLYAVGGSYLDDVNANVNQGSVLAYKYNGTSWVLLQKFWDPLGANNDYFGGKVWMSDPYIMVSASGDDVGSNTDQGSVFIYGRVGTVWQRIQQITDPAGNMSDFLGSDIEMDPSTKRFLIGVQGFNSYRGKCLFGKFK